MIDDGEEESLGTWSSGRASGILLSPSLTAGRTPEPASSWPSLAFRCGLPAAILAAVPGSAPELVNPPDREAKISGLPVPDSPHLKALRAPGSIMTTTGRVAALVLVLAVIR
jgi:hypothetical protein